MPITRRSAGIDGRCAIPTISARSEFARSTILPCLKPRQHGALVPPKFVAVAMRAPWQGFLMELTNTSTSSP